MVAELEDIQDARKAGCHVVQLLIEGVEALSTERDGAEDSDNESIKSLEMDFKENANRCDFHISSLEGLRRYL